MNRATRPDGLSLNTREAQTPSPAHLRRMSMSPTASVMTIPSVNPEPAYIAPAAAATIVVAELGSEFEMQVEDERGNTLDVATVLPNSLALINSFLDRLLFNFLSCARSTSLASLRPAIVEVLKPRLAKDAIAGADEELQEYLGGDDDELNAFHNGQDTPMDWDLELLWRRARLRCMVYTRLGDMEEEDEEMYIAQERLEDEDLGKSVSREYGIVSPAVAIFLTSILEFVGEHALIIATHAAFKRTETRLAREIAAGSQQTAFPMLLLEESDVEKIALNPNLGRLWRSWRKGVRSPRDSTSGRPMRTISIGSTSRKSSVAGISDMQSAVPAVTEEEEIDPADLPLPMSEHDVDEIEVPGYSAARALLAQSRARPISFLLIQDRLQQHQGAAQEGELETIEQSPIDSETTPVPQRTRTRSQSLPILRTQVEAQSDADSFKTPDEELPETAEKISTSVTALEQLQALQKRPRSEPTTPSYHSLLHILSQRVARPLQGLDPSELEAATSSDDADPADGVLRFNGNDYIIDENERAEMESSPTVEMPAHEPTDAAFASVRDAPKPVQTHLSSFQTGYPDAVAAGDISPMEPEPTQSGEVSPIESSDDEQDLGSAGLSKKSTREIYHEPISPLVEAHTAPTQQPQAEPAPAAVPVAVPLPEPVAAPELASPAKPEPAPRTRPEPMPKPRAEPAPKVRSDTSAEARREPAPAPVPVPAPVEVPAVPPKSLAKTDFSTDLPEPVQTVPAPQTRQRRNDARSAEEQKKQGNREEFVVGAVPVVSAALQKTAAAPSPKDRAVEDSLSRLTRTAPPQPAVSPTKATVQKITEPTPNILEDAEPEPVHRSRRKLPPGSSATPAPVPRPTASQRSQPPVANPAPGVEKAAVQRVTGAPSSRDSTIISSQIPTIERRNSRAQSKQSKPRGRISSASENIRGSVGSRISTEGKSSGEERYSRGSVAKGMLSNDFDSLIASEETIQYTLTPQNMRNIEQRKSDASTSVGTAVVSPPPRDDSVAYAAQSRSIPTAPVPTQREIANANSAATSRRGPTAVPREARVSSDNTKDFADFIRSTGPAIATGPTADRLPVVSTRSSLIAKEQGRIRTSKAGPRLQAREPKVRASENEDLIHFLREGPPSERSERTPNPPRLPPKFDQGSVSSAQDSFMNKSFQSSTNSRTGLLESTRNSNRPAPTVGMRQPVDDDMPKRKQRRVRDPYAIDSDSEEEDEDMASTPKAAGRGGNEDRGESLADFLNSVPPPAGGNSPPPLNLSKKTIEAVQRRSSTAGNKLLGHLPGAGAVSRIGGAGRGGAGAGAGAGGGSGGNGMNFDNDISPQPRFTRPKPQARVERGGRGGGVGGGGESMRDLADFLKNSEPPPSMQAPIQAPKQSGKDEGGLSKMFNRRKKSVGFS